VSKSSSLQNSSPPDIYYLALIKEGNAIAGRKPLHFPFSQKGTFLGRYNNSNRHLIRGFVMKFDQYSYDFGSQIINNLNKGIRSAIEISS
jgi:hypothetical protein